MPESDRGNRSAWSGTGKGKGAKGKTEETPDWWEARGGGEGRGGGGGRGGEEGEGGGEGRGGGQGKGGNWQKPGTLCFLKSRRKMLTRHCNTGGDPICAG